MAQEGIATLPQSPENQQMSGGDLAAVKQAVSEQLPPGTMQQYDQNIDAIISQINTSPEQLQQLVSFLEGLLKDPSKYTQVRQQMLAEGVDPAGLPEQFDSGFFTVLLVVCKEVLNRRGGGQQQMPMPPQGFKRGGLAEVAQALASKGRGGDTILAHINPQEAALLKRMGGSGTINPATGLPEFFKLSNLNPVKLISSAYNDVVKPILASPVGRIIATVALTFALGPAGGALMSLSAAAALSAGAVSLAGGSDLKTALTSAALAGTVGYLAPGISESATMQGLVGSGYLNSAATGALMGAGVGALTGQNIGKSALMGGIAGGATGAFSGQSAFDAAPQSTAAPVYDKSSPYGPPDATPYGPPDATPSGSTSASGIANQSGSITPGSQGISTLPSGSGATNVTATQMGPSYQEMGYNGLNTGQAGPSYQEMGYTGSSLPVSPMGSFNQPAPSGPEQMGPTYRELLGPTGPSGGSAEQPSSFGLDSITDFAKANKGLVIGGALALAGGLGSKPSNSPPPDLTNAKLQLGGGKTSEDLIRENPDRYLVNTNPTSYNTQVDQNTRTLGDINAYNPNRFMGSPGQQPGNFFGNQPTSATAQNPYDFMNGYRPFRQPQMYAQGGISQHYPRARGGVSGPGTGTSDSIPAMLSDGEFVITAKAVKGAGNGSRRSGAKALYRMMHALEKKAGGSV
jgi:hypothetical protein